MSVISTIIRVFVERDELDKTIQFYEALYQEKCNLRFKYNEVNLELAQVSKILIIAGDCESRRPFEDTKVTILVDSIHNIEKILVQQEGTILKAPKQVPTGWNMVAKHPDGLVVEYVEHVKRLDPST